MATTSNPHVDLPALSHDCFWSSGATCQTATLDDKGDNIHPSWVFVPVDQIYYTGKKKMGGHAKTLMV